MCKALQDMKAKAHREGMLEGELKGELRGELKGELKGIAAERA